MPLLLFVLAAACTEITGAGEYRVGDSADVDNPCGQDEVLTDDASLHSNGRRDVRRGCDRQRVAALGVAGLELALEVGTPDSIGAGGARQRGLVPECVDAAGENVKIVRSGVEQRSILRDSEIVDIARVG